MENSHLLQTEGNKHRRGFDGNQSWSPVLRQGSHPPSETAHPRTGSAVPPKPVLADQRDECFVWTFVSACFPKGLGSRNGVSQLADGSLKNSFWQCPIARCALLPDRQTDTQTDTWSLPTEPWAHFSLTLGSYLPLLTTAVLATRGKQ